MRTLTETLLAAQRSGSAVPYVKVTASNLDGGVVRLAWERLYEGAEDDYCHAAAVAGDGSLIRARVTLPGDARKLYIQRTASPGPASDFSAWTYTGQYNVVAVAAAALDAEVSVFWIKTNREIRRIVSADNGANWGSPELIGYTPTTAIGGLAAAYKPNGDLALFFTDQTTLSIKKRTGGNWQSATAWNETTGTLSGVACVYDGDWNLLLAGDDTAGNGKLWELVYGDGSAFAAGTWSVLKELAGTPAGGDYTLCQPFLDKPDVYRGSYGELFSGTEAYQRPFCTSTVPGSTFAQGYWREPAPLDVSCAYGIALAHDGSYCWLSTPSGVWRASRTMQELDLTDDVLDLDMEDRENGGGATITLRNDDGRYAKPGEDDLAVLTPGCRIACSPGCVTPAGAEYSDGSSFRLEQREHLTAGGRSVLVLTASDGHKDLAGWNARYQLRWNKTGDDCCVRDILAAVLARCGLALETVSASTTITGFYPDFSVNPGADGASVVRRLLDYVPDVLAIEGTTARIIYPLPDDVSVYAYGDAHPIRQGRYRAGTRRTNRVQIEGYDDATGDRLLADGFNWDEIGRTGERWQHREERSIGTAAAAAQLAETQLRHSELEAAAGSITVPVNCGQQLYDVIDITDTAAGLQEERRRIRGIALAWHPARGDYVQKLALGAV